MTLTERVRIAQELHDGIAQDLVGVGYSLDLILTDESTPLETRAAIRKVRLEMTDLLNKVRTEIHDLREQNRSSISAQIRQSCVEICHEQTFTFALLELPIVLEDETAHQVMRIVRELFRNIARHSQATEIKVFLTHADGLAEVRIRDNGQGFVAHESDSFGLSGSALRAVEIQGSLTWLSDESGFETTLKFPLSDTRL